MGKLKKDDMNLDKLKIENECKKEYLKSYRQAIIAVKFIEEEIALLKLDKISPSIKYSNVSNTGNHHTDLSDYMVTLEKLTNKLYSAKYKRIKLYSTILEKTEEMEDEIEKNLLRAKYIHMKTWEEVADIMGYGNTQIHRLHTKALLNFKME